MASDHEVKYLVPGLERGLQDLFSDFFIQSLNVSQNL